MRSSPLPADCNWEQGLFTLYREAEERGAALIAGGPSHRRSDCLSRLPDLASRFAAATLLTLRPLDEDRAA